MTVQFNSMVFKPDYGDLPDHLKPVYKALLTNPYRKNPVTPDRLRKIFDKAQQMVQQEN